MSSFSRSNPLTIRIVLALVVGVACGVSLSACADETGGGSASASTKSEYPRQLGAGSPKIKREGDKTAVWAGGAPPGSKDAHWYDFTGAPFPPEELQFGIGKDRIPAINDPVFVKPDDPRLLEYIPPSPYRKDERPKTNDEIPVIGYARGDDVRAYPIALLDHHELVNDLVGGKPVTVGW